jgi:hypothetical protein
MSRALFAIPLAGFALVGCGDGSDPIIEVRDPIIGTWNVTQVAEDLFPQVYEYNNANGAACTITYSFVMIVNENFTMDLNLNYLYECADGIQNPPVIETYQGSITVVEIKAKYNINVEGAVLPCDMANNNALECDLDGEVLKFSLVE